MHHFLHGADWIRSYERDSALSRVMPMNSGPDAFAALRRHGSHNAMFQLVGNIALHRDCHAAVGVRRPSDALDNFRCKPAQIWRAVQRFPFDEEEVYAAPAWKGTARDCWTK